MVFYKLIRYNVHIGHYYWETNYIQGYMVIGLRNLISIINLYNTIYNIKRILYIINSLGIEKQRILLTNNINYKTTRNFLHEFDKNKLWYIDNNWVGGLLTNQKNIYVYNEKLFNNYYKVGYKSILPAFIFSSNIENNKSCIFEAMILNIVNSALYDTDLNFYGIFYKIMSNDDNFAIMVFFIKMLSKIYVRSLYITIKRVLQLKDLKILRKIWRKKKNKKNSIKEKKYKKLVKKWDLMDSKNTIWKYVKKIKYAYPQKKTKKENKKRKIKEKKINYLY